MPLALIGILITFAGCSSEQARENNTLEDTEITTSMPEITETDTTTESDHENMTDNTTTEPETENLSENSIADDITEGISEGVDKVGQFAEETGEKISDAVTVQ